LNELTKNYSEEISHILAKYPPEDKRSALMSLLYLAQRETGRVSQETMHEIATTLEISETDVASIAGFYTLFHEEPGGRYRIQICNDLPCALRGSQKFLEELCAYLGVNSGETTDDGLFTLEEVKCLAACHRAPMFQLQGDGEISYHEEQTLQLAKELIEHIRTRVQKEAKV
jgi:NADH-quinone oxidoreductase subunit E